MGSIVLGRVAALPRRQRDVVLHYVDDLPISEIATIVGVAEGTVKSDLSRARTRLRDEIERESERGEVEFEGLPGDTTDEGNQ